MARRTSRVNFSAPRYVYGIACGKELLKIGWARSVPHRLKDLSSANPFTLTVKYCLKSTYAHGTIVEKWLHDRLRAQRVHKEWFCGKSSTFERAFEEVFDAFQHLEWFDEWVGLKEPYFRDDYWGTTTRKLKVPPERIEKEVKARLIVGPFLPPEEDRNKVKELTGTWEG